MDDIDWKISNSTHNENFSKRPLHKRYNRNLTMTTGLHSFSIECHIVHKESDKSTSNECIVTDSSLPTVIPCFSCKSDMKPNKVGCLYANGAVCDECEQDLLPEYVCYHCDNPSHNTNVTDGYDVCLKCVFKSLKKDIHMTTKTSFQLLQISL